MKAGLVRRAAPLALVMAALTACAAPSPNVAPSDAGLVSPSLTAPEAPAPGPAEDVELDADIVYVLAAVASLASGMTNDALLAGSVLPDEAEAAFFALTEDGALGAYFKE